MYTLCEDNITTNFPTKKAYINDNGFIFIIFHEAPWTYHIPSSSFLFVLFFFFFIPFFYAKKEKIAA
jgi:hypothetical protein